MTQHGTTLRTTVPSSTEPVETGRLPLLVLLAGIFLVVLDFFIVNVTLPSMQRDLHASDTALEWVIAGYGLAYGALLLAATRLGDRWGRRRLYAAGVTSFVAASAACGAAPTMEVLVAARVVQGAAGAMIAPMVLALLGDVYTGAAYRRAIAAYSGAMGLAAVAGQLIGGVLIQLDVAGLGWRSVFLVNVPVGLAILSLVRRHVPAARSAHSTRVDVLELGLATAMLLALLLPLLEGPRLGWPLWTWLSLVASVVLAEGLVFRSRALLRRGADPLLRIVLTGPRILKAGLLQQFVLYLGMASFFLVLALYLQVDRGLGALESGEVFTIVAVAYVVGTRVTAEVAKRCRHWTISLSALVFLAGHLLSWLAVVDLGPSASILWLAPGLAVAGLGMGVCLTSQIGTVMSSATPRDAAVVSGTLSTVQQVGNCVGVALIGLVYFEASTAHPGAAFAESLLYLVAAMGVLAVLGWAAPRRLPAMQG